jgi:HEAT repeat protein
VTAEPLPILGGLALCRAGETGGAGPRFLGGTHGLLVCSGAMGPDNLRLHWPEESVQVVQSARQAQVSEAAKAAIPQRLSPEQLQRFLADANPYVVANALAATLLPILDGRTGYAPIIGACVSHPCGCVRTTAVYLLSQIRDDAVIEPLRTALQDGNASVRAMAALALARRGHAPDISYFEEIFQREGSYGEIPFGAASRMSTGIYGGSVYEALAHDATPAGFTLLMKYPPNIQAYDNATKVFPPLGEALRKHPEAADILLHAADDRPGDDSNKVFARHVFRGAGREMLPILHRALTSNDRVVRSNAARACGAIGDPSSIPVLIAALDLESGLARASIVWALGELKAREALPHLAQLYVDAANDERRRQGGGFRAAQSQAVLQAQFESLSNLDAVGADWTELKEATLPRPADPQKNERLLTPAVILEAVSKIGSEEAQEFYRTLAGQKDIEARSEAAIRLAEGGPEDKQKNLTILRNLLADSSEAVRTHAAVSLLILGEDTVEAPILEWLRSTSMSGKYLILRDLGRVRDASRLAFAQEQMAALASDSLQPENMRDLARALTRGGRTPPETEGRRGPSSPRVRPSSQTP